MKRILLLSFAFLTVVAFSAMAQRTVSGKVTDDTGEALPGVNVVIKGTTTGVTTDLDGNYRLSVEDGATLIFSYVGFATQEIEVGARTTIDISMSGATELQEVIVTAIGLEREKKALGYSVENVEGDKVQQVAEPDPLRALQGKIAGVNIGGSSGAPGSSTRITIRGNNSLLGNNQPLFVVDGIPYDNSQTSTFSGLGSGGAPGSRIADLDPNNIASITVLKSGSAAALYGSRAANGAVVITTKTGSATRSNKGMEVSVSSTVAFTNIANLPNLQNTYGTGTSFNYAQANGSWGHPFPGTRPYANTTTIPHWYNNVVGFEELWGTTVPYRAYPDNVENLFRTGVQLDNSINITNSTEKGSLSLTLSRLNDDGYVPSDEFNRTSISVGGRSFLDNGLIVNGNLAYTVSNRTGAINGAGNVGGNNTSAFSRALFLGRNWDVHGQPFTNPRDGGSAFMVGRGQADNPLWSYENAGTTERTNRIAANIGLSYDVTDWINLTLNGGINSYNQRNTTFLRPGSTGPVANPGAGQFTDDYLTWEELDMVFLASVNKPINSDISFSGLLGTNINQRTNNGQAYQGTGYVTFDIDDIDNTNDVVPIGRGFSRRRLVGVFAEATFGYRDFAFVTLNARNDWSSTLPQDGNSFFYPAVSASFLPLDAFDVTSNIVSSLKVRGGWSEVGTDTAPYQLQAVFGVNNAGYLPFEGTPGAFLSGTERDPNLVPETTREVEVGFDLGLLNDRVTLAATYYKRNTRDQIAPITLPSETGFTQLFTNFGEVSNEGIELTLGANPISTSYGLDWNINATFTHNKNVIEDLGGIDQVLFGAFLLNLAHQPGKEFGLLQGSRSARDDEGNLLIDPSSGQMIRDPELGIIGNPNPDFLVGITNTVSYKGITLNAVFDWRQGGDFFSNTIQSMQGRGVLAFQADREENRVIPGVYGNPNTFEPVRTAEGNKITNTTMIETNTLYFGESFASNGAQEWNVYDGTTYRLREISLSYQLPASLLENIFIGSASIGVTGRNLWYWAPNVPEDTNFDPEVNSNGATNAQGVEVSATPTTRRYAINLRFTF